MGPARAFLRNADARLLDVLLEHSRYALVIREGLGPFDDDEVYVELESPPAFSKAIEGLPELERERIVRAIAANDSDVPEHFINASRLLLADRTDVRVPPRQAFLAEVIGQKDMLIDVATGGARINDVNDYYKIRRRRLAGLFKAFGMEDPNPFEDLWDWYRKWREEEWSTYEERRQFIRDLYDPVIADLLGPDPMVVPMREPTGWDRVDRALNKARDTLDTASEAEDFQSVGLLCREILISLGQAVFDPGQHSGADGVQVSKTDAKRMLEAFISAMVPGESNETVRWHARASLSLALELQHRRTATFRLAALCLEATASTVNVVAILAGIRDPLNVPPADG